MAGLNLGRPSANLVAGGVEIISQLAYRSLWNGVIIYMKWYDKTIRVEDVGEMRCFLLLGI